jgi:hypothetical protein
MFDARGGLSENISRRRVRDTTVETKNTRSSFNIQCMQPVCREISKNAHDVTQFRNQQKVNMTFERSEYRLWILKYGALN